MTPACGTGGMLTVAKEKISEFNPKVKIGLFGQEINDSTYHFLMKASIQPL